MGDATAARVADAESAFCMQCSAEFWLLLRRHHCMEQATPRSLRTIAQG